MRTNNIFLLTIFLLATKLVVGQNSNGLQKINLKPYSLDKNICILFQNDTFIIMTSTKYLADIYAQEQSSDSTGWQNTEKKLFLECNKTNPDTLDFYSFLKGKSLDGMLNNRTAYLIKANACVVLNKKTNKNETKISFKPYARFDVEGKTYFVNGKLLFETIEIVW